MNAAGKLYLNTLENPLTVMPAEMVPILVITVSSYLYDMDCIILLLRVSILISQESSGPAYPSCLLKRPSDQSCYDDIIWTNGYGFLSKKLQSLSNWGFV